MAGILADGIIGGALVGKAPPECRVAKAERPRDLPDIRNRLAFHHRTADDTLNMFSKGLVVVIGRNEIERERVQQRFQFPAATHNPSLQKARGKTEFCGAGIQDDRDTRLGFAFRSYPIVFSVGLCLAKPKFDRISLRLIHPGP